VRRKRGAGRWRGPAILLFGIVPLAMLLFLTALWFFWPPLELLRVDTGVPTYPRTAGGTYRTSLPDYAIYHEQVLAFETADSVEQVRQFYNGYQLPSCYTIYVTSQKSRAYPSPFITARAELIKRDPC